MGSFKAISCWSFPRPGEEEEFERHYWDVHVPLAAAIPGTVSLTLTLTDEGLEDDAALLLPRRRDRLREQARRSPRRCRRRSGRRSAPTPRSMHERFGVTLANGLGNPVAVELTAEG